MAKFKVSVKGNIVTVTKKQLRKYHINEREVKKFEESVIPGFFRPQIINKDRIEYVAPWGVTLESYIKDKFTVHKFYSILTQIVEMTKRIEKYGLYLHNVVLDMKLIYIKKATGELFFLYEPLMERKNFVNVFAFLEDVSNVMDKMKNLDTQLEEEGQKLKDFLNKPEHYKISDIEQFITTNYPQIYQQISATPKVETCQHSETEKGTILLVEEEGTTLLEDEGTTLLQSEPTATLLRQRTGEVIVISGMDFHIGKSISADYTLTDNNTISRTHAVISRKFDEYVITDENSKNHTYVNGVMVVAGQSQVLRNGDIIRLSDEEFEFSI